MALEHDPRLEKKERDQIAYHLLIRNDTEAVKRSAAAYKQFPHSLKIRKLYLESLACLGDERLLLKTWQQLSRDFPDQKYESEILESVVKGVLHHASLSEAYSTRHCRLSVVDAFSDANSVEFLREALLDQDFVVREMALDACLKFGDEKLVDVVIELLKSEKVASVRKKAIEVLLRIKGQEMTPLVEKIFAESNLAYSDRLFLLITWIQDKKSISRPELERLVKSPHAVERLLACLAFKYFDLAHNYDLVQELLFDPIVDVRYYALMTVGVEKINQINGKSMVDILSSQLKDPNPEIAMLACWALMLQKVEGMENQFRPFLFHTDQKIRLQASSLIGYSLPYTHDLALEFFNTHTDPFVRLNLSLYLLLHREQVHQCCDQIYAFIKNQHSCQFKESFPYPLQTIWPTALLNDQERNASYTPSCFQQEIVQFCLLNTLAIVEDERALGAISSFLDTHHSSIALASISQFGQAGSSEVVHLISSFLNHPDLNKRVQAASLLALLKEDHKALEVLYQSYPDADRRLKEMIIIVIGKAAAKESIPFLMETLYQPSQSMRILVVSSLMQCIRS